MKLTEAFINVSLFSYLGCIFLAGIGLPPITNWSQALQIPGFIVAMAVLLYSSRTTNRLAQHLCAGTYGFVAMLTVSGAIKWAGGNNAGLAMALWDILIGMAMLASEKS